MDAVIAGLTQAGGNLVALLSKGGLVMVPLVVASILSLAVILERWRYWRRFRQHESGEQVLALVTAGHLTQALQMARASAHPVAQVLLAGLEHPSPSPGMVMQAAAQAAVRHLRCYLPLLDTIITLAPLLGLLGTITGMISAFGIVSDAGLGQPHAITGGVAEALIATASGLSVAMLALLPYNYLRAKTATLADLMEERATQLEALLQESQAREER